MMPYMAPVYFSTFVLASQFVLVNVVVAVLMKQLEDAKEVTPANSKGSGLNDDLEISPGDDGEEVLQATDDGDKNDEKINKDNIEMTPRHRDVKTLSRYDNDSKTPSLFNENEPLLRSSEVNLDFDSLNANLVSLNDAKETSIECDEPDGSSSIPKKLSIQNNDNNNNNNNDECDSEVEQTVKDVLDGVVERTEQASLETNQDHLDVDILATVKALSGLRDSVISTCV